MRIGIASPISLELLAHRLDDWDGLTGTWAFPYIATLVDAYIDRGHDVHVFALNDRISVARRYSGPSLMVSVIPMRSDGRARARDFYKSERRQLTDAIERARLDVVHAHWTYEFGAAAVESSVPNVVTAHDSPWAIVGESRHLTITEDNRHRGWAMVRNARRAVLRSMLAERVVGKADIVTAVAPNVVRDLRRQFMARAPIRLIPNGLSGVASPARAEAHDRTSPVFGLIANGFGDNKNTVVALQALSILRRGRPGSRLILIGRGHEANGPARAWAKARGLDEGCEWLGELPHEETVGRLDEMDVLVHPSYFEACSIAIMEAQSHGVPVVGGAHSGGVPFSLQNGAAGLLVDIRDPGAVADAMSRLIEDAALYARLSLGGIEALARVFNLDLVVSEYERTLVDAMAGRP